MSIIPLAGPRRVEVSAIERELEALWKSVPPSGGGVPTAVAMRAVVANLVAITSTGHEAAQASEVTGQMIGRHPCRLILITSEPDVDPPALTAEVAVIRRQSNTSEHRVCCEQIRLAAQGIMADNLPSVAASLYIADLPIIVWWSNPPFLRKDFSLFAAQADRVVVDSARFSHDDLRQLARFVEQSRSLGTAVSDLNWGRLTPYRQLFAQFFDSVEYRDNLSMIDKVRIEGHVSTGLLLAGWLKAQMESSGCGLARERIVVTSTDPGTPPFGSLGMTCENGTNEFAVAQKDDQTVEARATVGAKTFSRVAQVGFQSMDTLLAEEIGFSGRDTVFEAAVTAAAL